MLLFSAKAQVLEDEMDQARVHYMYSAKVSYLASSHEIMQQATMEPGTLEIPQEILDAFQQLYADATHENWIIKEDRYKVHFSLEGKAMFTYLDRRGHWIKSLTKISEEHLPEAVTNYLDAHHPEHQLVKYYLKDTPNGKSFVLAVKKNNQYHWLEFDKKGSIVNSQV